MSSANLSSIRSRVLAIALSVTVVALAGAANTWGQTKYYRYTNKEGVKVMNSFVPPEYVKNGYEVVTLSGEVIEVVEAAPSEEEAEQMAALRQRQAQLAAWDESLLKRYSTVADIEGAKERKLRDFDASLAILRGNANNIRTQIEQVQARAASLERSGRVIPDSTLNSLRALQLELEDTERQLEQREEDKLEIARKYDEDIERFRVIKSESKTTIGKAAK